MLHLQPTQTIAHQCILVYKYNKKQLLFKKNIKNIQNFQKTFNKAGKEIHQKPHPPFYFHIDFHIDSQQTVHLQSLGGVCKKFG